MGLFVNTITSARRIKHRIVKLDGWVHCTKISADFEFQGHRPPGITPKNVALQSLRKMLTKPWVGVALWHRLSVRK